MCYFYGAGHWKDNVVWCDVVFLLYLLLVVKVVCRKIDFL